MAQSIYARAAGRGFPVWDASGQTGQGALQDSTAPAPVTGLPTATWTDPNTDPGSVPAVLPPPEMELLGLTLWGLGGSPNPDDTSRSHAAPMTDPALLAMGEDGGTHAPVFTGAALMNPGSGQSEVGTLTRMRQGRDQGQGSTADNLEPLSGQIRSNAGMDAVQGYGGGGPGPGGVNDPQGPVTDVMTFGGQTYTNVMVQAAEVPFLSADAVQFIVTAPEFPPYAPSFDGPTASVLAQQAGIPDVPAQGAQLAPAAPAYAGYAPGFWG